MVSAQTASIWALASGKVAPPLAAAIATHWTPLYTTKILPLYQAHLEGPLTHAASKMVDIYVEVVLPAAVPIYVDVRRYVIRYWYFGRECLDSSISKGRHAINLHAGTAYNTLVGSAVDLLRSAGASKADTEALLQVLLVLTGALLLLLLRRTVLLLFTNTVRATFFLLLLPLNMLVGILSVLFGHKGRKAKKQ